MIVMRLLAAIALVTALATPRPATAQSFGIASFFAIVSSQGSTLKGSGIQGSARTARGKYLITFTRPVTSCVFVATVNGNAPGQASVSGPGASPRRVTVSTFSTSGVAANRRFNLLAYCAG